MTITYSIIAPIYNEIDNLSELYRRVKEVMDANGEPWELILVDDGSTDGSTEKIRELVAQDKTVRPVIFARNFGHQVAITAGWDYARGEAIVIIDADLQDPPEIILELAKKWKEGYEVVYAVRGERDQTPRPLPAALAGRGAVLGTSTRDRTGGPARMRRDRPRSTTVRRRRRPPRSRG